VTGGCGFIGTNLIAHLLKENPQAKIRVLDNLSVGTKEDLADVCNFTELSLDSQNPQSSIETHVELIVGDIRDYDVCLRFCEGIDIVIHLAASTGVPYSVEYPKNDMEANVTGTFNMLEASRHSGIKKFIFASSGAPIGECEPPIHEEVAPHPVSPYGASKLAGEAYCSTFYNTFDLETVSLRFGNVYGPGSNHKSSVIAKFIKLAIKGETLEIYGDGGQTRDFIYIDDLIRAVLLSAMANGIGGETFQIATNTETTISEVLDKLVPILAESGFKDVKVFHGAPRTGDIRRNYSDTTKAQKFLGWEIQIKLTQGLKQTVDWFIIQERK
jgi:UDP-glucose 4-epimerase